MVLSSEQTFHWVDYVVFALALLLSVGIGVYYGVVDYRRRALRKRQAKADPTRDIRRGSGLKRQLLGGQDMTAFPVAMSILASFMAAPFLLGTPVEFYMFGSLYCAVVLSLPLTAVLTAHLFVPHFHKQQVASSYEYLETRFNKKVRLVSSTGFCLLMIVYMGVVIYAPAAAFSLVTGLPTEYAILATGVVCTFYTAFGGMKAVIWSDVLQMLIILAAMIALTTVGIIDVGGVGRVVDIVTAGKRIQVDDALSLDPTVRHTWWTQIIGGLFLNMSLTATNQGMIQRYLSMKTQKEAQKCVYIAASILIIYMLLILAIGLIMYAFYAGCDPLVNGTIDNVDQLVPLFVMDCLGKYLGLPGLFTAAVFSASLSTVASGLNALSAVMISDYIHPLYHKFKGDVMADNTSSIVSKLLSFVMGIITVALAFVAPYMGNTLLEIGNILFGLIGGPLFGLFSLAIFVPFANSWGALVGTIASFLLTLWIAVGGMIHPYTPPVLPLDNSKCQANKTVDEYTSTFTSYTTDYTTSAPKESPGGGIVDLYKLSYMWYTLAAFLVCMFLGIIVSLITGGNKNHYVDPNLLYPYQKKCPCCMKLACCHFEIMGSKIPEKTPSEIYEPDNEEEAMKMRKFSRKSVVTFADAEEEFEISSGFGTNSDVSSQRSIDDISSLGNYSQDNVYIISDGAVYRKQSELDDIELISHWRKDSRLYENMMRRKSLAISGAFNLGFEGDKVPNKINTAHNGVGHVHQRQDDGELEKDETIKSTEL